jgi:cytochrome c oxidase subunit III
MPGAITDEIEVVRGRRDGGGGDAGGGDDGGDSGGLPRIPQRAYYTILQLSLAGIMMFFAALTSAFLVRKELGTDWAAFELPRILWFNTLVLMASSFTAEVARRKSHRDEWKAFRAWWALTTALGLVFLAGQLTAWGQLRAEGVFLATNPNSSFFYLLTALHGLHLAGGIVALLYVRFRRWQRSGIPQSTAADLASIYWHFMDGLWVFLLALLYLGR